MAEAVRALKPQGGDPVSTEFLKADLYRRVQALIDDPDTPLYFGRIDREEGEERLYIGRRHVRDRRGDPVVIDWRAAVSRAFYRASAEDRMGVVLRRRFGFSHGELTSLEDEHLARGEARDPSSSGILTAEIERPRVGPMRDIVATIQPDQDDLLRVQLAETICIQGAPGTGKTAVGLHRAAYLLYAHREQLRRSGVLVVGPNRSFLGYIGALLPALGEVDVQQVAIDDLAGAVSIRAADTAAGARLKGDERLAEVIRRAVYADVRHPREDLVVNVPGWRSRIPRHELVELVDGQWRSGTPYEVVRGRLGVLVAENVRRRVEAAGGAPDDRAVRRLAREAPVRAWVDEHWPAVTAPAVVFRLLSDAEFLARCAAGILTEVEQRALLWDTVPTGVRRARWTLAETFLIDEAQGVLVRPASYGHVVVDEAQDLSPMQCRALARRCPTGSATVLGDIAQATAAHAIADWGRTLALLGHDDARLVTLTRGYRVPSEVLDFANQLLPALGDGLQPATSLRRAVGSLRVHRTIDLTSAAAEALTGLLEMEGSVGVIGDEGHVSAVHAALLDRGIAAGDVQDGMESRVTLVPVTLCKGLEFDHVLVLEPAGIRDSLARGLHWLYVALTRAVSTLTIVHRADLPEELSSATGWA